MKALPYFVVAGALALGLIGAVATGEWLILVVVAIVGLAYVALMRSRAGGDESREERMSSRP